MDEFGKRNRDNMLAWRDAILAYALFYPAVEFLSFATIALIYWSGGNRILSGGITSASSPPSLCSPALFPSHSGSQRKIQHSSIRRWPLERIFKLLDEPVVVESDPNAIPLDHPVAKSNSATSGSSYRNSQSPPNEDWVLRDVSFRVEPGQTFAHRRPHRRRQDTLISCCCASTTVHRSNPPRRQRTFASSSPGSAPQFRHLLQDPFLFTGTSNRISASQPASTAYRRTRR